MEGDTKAVVVGTLVVANVLMFAFVWGYLGAWLVPWLLGFWHAPLVGGLVWVIGR